MKKFILITIVAVLILGCVLVGCEEKTGDLATTDLSVVINRVGEDALYAPESGLTYNIPHYYDGIPPGGGPEYNYEVKIEDFDFYIEISSVYTCVLEPIEVSYVHYLEWGDIKIGYGGAKYYTEKQYINSENIIKTYDYTEINFTIIENPRERRYIYYDINCKYQDENNEKWEDLKRVVLDYLSTFKRGSELI